MKSKIFFVLLAILTFSAVQNSYAIKIKYHGSGGMVVNGDHYDICPDAGSGLCAVVEGNLWDLLDHWLNAPTWDDVPVGTLGANSAQVLSSPLTVTVFGPNGTQTIYSNAVFKFQPGVTMKKTDQSTAETFDCNKIAVKILN